MLPWFSLAAGLVVGVVIVVMQIMEEKNKQKRIICSANYTTFTPPRKQNSTVRIKEIDSIPWNNRCSSVICPTFNSTKDDDSPWSSRRSPVISPTFNSTKDDDFDLESHLELGRKIQAIDGVLASADNCTDLAKVLDELKDLNIEYPNNAEVLWRLGAVYYKISEKSRVDREKHIKIGLKCCQRAVKQNPKLAAGHKWLAMLLEAEEKQTTEESSDRSSPVDDNEFFDTFSSLEIGNLLKLQ